MDETAGSGHRSPLGPASRLSRRLRPRRREAHSRPAAEPAARNVPTADTGARPMDQVIGDCAVYENGYRRPGKVPLEEAGRAAGTTDGFVWIGLQQPSAAQIEIVASTFGLPALAVEDAVKAHQRPKLEVYADGVVFVVLKPVHYVDHEQVVDVSEIALFLGPNFVVSVRHGQSDVLHRVRTELDSGGGDMLTFGPTAVLYRTADLVVDEYEEAVDCITDDVDDIEIQVFGGDDKDHAERIYKLKREIAEFRRAVFPLGPALMPLAEGSVRGVDPATSNHFRDVHDHAMRAADAIEGQDRLLSDVLQANLARVSVRQSQIALRQNEIAVRQNEDMRKISAWAAIALVPTAIAGVYGMNFENMPELQWKYGYFMVLALITVCCLGLHRLFRHNGWL